MRKITMMATAAGALATASAFASRANADRVCWQECEAGFCKTVCVDENDHIFFDNSDKDFFIREGRPHAFLGR